jgi:hypothetical protein
MQNLVVFCKKSVKNTLWLLESEFFVQGMRVRRTCTTAVPAVQLTRRLATYSPPVLPSNNSTKGQSFFAAMDQ